MTWREYYEIITFPLVNHEWMYLKKCRENSSFMTNSQKNRNFSLYAFVFVYIKFYVVQTIWNREKSVQ